MTEEIEKDNNKIKLMLVQQTHGPSTGASGAAVVFEDSAVVGGFV